MKLKKEYEKGFWININALSVKKCKSGDDVENGILVIPSRETLQTGITVDVVKCSILEKDDKRDISKKEASLLLLEAMKKYMLQTNRWPPHTTIKKILKNGTVRLEYSPVPFASFTVAFPAVFDGHTSVEFLEALDFPIEDAGEDDLWIFRGKWINPRSFMMKQSVDDLPEEPVVFIEKTVNQKSGINLAYRVLESKEKGESATKEEITGILSEQLVKYMREQGTWPRTTRLSSYAEDGSAMISYGPEPDVNIELRITEDQIGDKLPKFLGSLKTMEERIQEAEAHLTWRVEHAKSGRAACRACSEKIQKGELRIGEPSLFQDHVSYKWYHVDCSSRKSFFLSPVEGLEQLTPEEKKELVNNGLLDDE